MCDGKLKIGAAAANFLPDTVIPTPINYKVSSSQVNFRWSDPPF